MYVPVQLVEPHQRRVAEAAQTLVLSPALMQFDQELWVPQPSRRDVER